MQETLEGGREDFDRAGLYREMGDYEKAWDDLKAARDHLERAKALIGETGYHRRDSEVEELG